MSLDVDILWPRAAFAVNPTLEATAFHEAAHAILAMVCGFKVWGASIEPDYVERELPLSTSPLGELEAIIRSLKAWGREDEELDTFFREMLHILSDLRPAVDQGHPKQTLEDRFHQTAEQLALLLTERGKVPRGLASALKRALTHARKAVRHARLGHVSREWGLEVATGPLTAEERDRVERHAVVCRAGYEAETEYGIGDAEDAAASDFRNFDKALNRLIRTPEEGPAYGEMLCCRSAGLLKANWHAIEVVAELLLEKTTVTGKDIERKLRANGIELLQLR